VNIDDIIRCESDGNNTIFMLASGEKIFVTKTLKQFATLFEHHTFYRTHQSHLINTKHIQEYIRKEGGYIKMKNGNDIPVAVRKKAEVVAMLCKAQFSFRILKGGTKLPPCLYRSGLFCERKHDRYFYRLRRKPL